MGLGRRQARPRSNLFQSISRTAKMNSSSKIRWARAAGRKGGPNLYVPPLKPEASEPG